MTGQRLPFTFDQVFVHNLWNQTDSMLDAFSRRVKEGKDVDAASNFCKWILRTGLTEMLRAHPQPLPLRCDGAELAHKVNLLLTQCNECYSHPQRPKTVELSAIEEINAKLEMLMANLPAKAA